MHVENLFRRSSASLKTIQHDLRQRLRRRAKQKARLRRSRSRRPHLEGLEARQLLAADVFATPMNDLGDDAALLSAADSLADMDGASRGASGFRSSLAPTVLQRPAPQNPLDGEGESLQEQSRFERLRGRRGEERNREEANPDAQPEFEVRSIDGVGNNLENPALGSAGQNLIRVADADYSDGIAEPAGDDRPSAREISNLLSAADADGTRSDRDLTAMLYVWGQFIDHDIDLSTGPAEEADEEAFDIQVPVDDALFNPAGADDVTIPLTRSDYDPLTGDSIGNPREQLNAITAFVDGSQVYGSDQETADSLREFVGGRMLLTDDGLLPTDENGEVMAGDIRAAENIALTSMQTLFVREHNRWADEIAAENPSLSDEEIYQQARSLVIAEIQSITYNEFLPALLGARGLASYQGYDASVDPSIANEFSTAAFRFGHSTLNDDIEFFGNDGLAVAEEIALADAFFNPALLEETGIDSILKYDASSLAQEIDLEVVDGLRNFLFGPPGAGGLDLVALNIQRGRDHGLADYNSTRIAYGLEPVESFADITSDAELQEKLSTLYASVDNIDLWVGLMAEDHTPDASVGELTGAIIADQFERIRDGDRLWYENVFSRSDVRAIEQTSLADIIERNTDVEGLQANVFFLRAEISGAVRTDDAVDTADRSRAGRSSRLGVVGVTVELLNDEGEVVDTTLTGRGGNYRFRSFDETGQYQVRLASSGETLDVLIDTGDRRIRGLNFLGADVS